MSAGSADNRPHRAWPRTGTHPSPSTPAAIRRGPKHLFVYGTLRSGSAHPMARLLAERADRVCDADLRGRLYLVASYPGAVDPTCRRDSVRGDLFRLHDAYEMLKRLDRYEDAIRSDGEFVRRVRPVVALPNGERIEAWVYLYNRSTHALRRIASGDFMAAAALRHP